jgi:hypothetical protein
LAPGKHRELRARRGQLAHHRGGVAIARDDVGHQPMALVLHARHPGSFRPHQHVAREPSRGLDIAGHQRHPARYFDVVCAADESPEAMEIARDCRRRTAAPWPVAEHRRQHTERTVRIRHRVGVVGRLPFLERPLHHHAVFPVTSKPRQHLGLPDERTGERAAVAHRHIEALGAT